MRLAKYEIFYDGYLFKVYMSFYQNNFFMNWGSCSENPSLENGYFSDLNEYWIAFYTRYPELEESFCVVNFPYTRFSAYREVNV